MRSSRPNLRPPKFGQWLLARLTHADSRYSALGDFEEIFCSLAEKSGRSRALLWYWRQISKSLPSFLMDWIYWSAAMFKNYLTVALRNIKKHAGYSFINITGLALGMAFTLLILLWVKDEISYDRFHENAGELHRVVLMFQNAGGGIQYATTTPGPLAGALSTTFPEIKISARLLMRRWGMGTREKRFAEVGALVDPAFVDMFSIEFAKGNPKTAFSDISNIVITEELAQKYFGAADPIGKTLRIEDWYDANITGVIKKIPPNSHLRFDYLIPFQILQVSGWNVEAWDANNFRTYILLQQGVSPQAVNEKIAGLIKNHIPESTATPILQPMTRIHLYALGGGGLITYIYIFTATALFVLLIACINYMNLAIPLCGTNRAREVGVRQVLGANRSQLIKQFLGESILLAVFAILLAVILVQIFLPVFNQITGKQLGLYFSSDITLALAAIALLTGIFSGSYPAFVLSSVQNSRVLKNTLQKKGGSSWFRKALVVMQFAISIFLMIGAITVYSQMRYMSNRNLGYEKENILWLEMRSELAHKYEVFKNELLKNPNIVSLTRSNTTPDVNESSAEGREVHWQGRSANDGFDFIKVYGVDEAYLNTFRLQMVDGRFFSADFQADLSESFVVNEAAVRAMGVESPVGKRFSLWNWGGRIIGVVKDFHFRSLHHEIEPLVMKMGWGLDNICIRIKPEDISGTIGFIESTVQNLIPDYRFDFKFIDEMIDRRYRTEQRMGLLVQAMTFLAIFISCMGLLGLASFTAEQRTKEIGIRKVLGASASGVVLLLSKEFAKWVVLANLIAWPAAWFAATNWLQNFAYRTDLGLLVFILSGAGALLIALLTVSFQSLKAALANPVEALRYE